MIRILIILLFLTSCSVVKRDITLRDGYYCIPSKKIYTDTIYYSDDSYDVIYYYYKGR